jgi:hypothetical protein
MEPNTTLTTLTPTRRLSAKERIIFDRLTSAFTHLQPSDEEQITQYAEANVRYQIAAKETKKNPTISVPVVNRSTGNVTGEKSVRNPSFTTLREATSQMNSLARRLMIDAHSSEKRLRLASKKLRSASGVVASNAASNVALASITEKEIKAEMRAVAKMYTAMTPMQVRAEAIWRLTDPYLNPQFLHPDYRMTQIDGVIVEDDDSCLLAPVN